LFFSVLRNAAVLEKRYGFCEEEERIKAQELERKKTKDKA
jgi:hypothetical protein